MSTPISLPLKPGEAIWFDFSLSVARSVYVVSIVVRP